MDPSVWRWLPDDLLDRILSLLPLRSLIALRPTCRRFSSLLRTPSFLSLLSYSSSSSPSSSFLLLSHPQFSRHSLPLYDPSMDYWKTITLSSSSLLSSSYGLLLFSLGPSSLLVSNILTNSSTTIPSPTLSSSSSSSSTATTTIISSFPSSSPHGYYIFLSNSDWIHLYSSRSHSWSRFPGFRSLLSHSSRNGVSFHGSLYFTTPEPSSVLAFDLEAGTWGPGALPALPDDLAFARLVSGARGKEEEEERLFLVGGVGSDGISRSLVAWEMVGGGGRSRRWEVVGRLPELMCRKFVSVCYHNYSHVYCLWQAGMVCVCCTTWPEVLFLKVGRGTWHWLPRCPLLQEKWSCGFRWFSFAPDLYALV
ncbi:F-box/kelch-repeat protein [Iris pallida]|uniref:F-box/kelch-repeat protein n=1 Tax=Iris pallida TaxID=29817 RepID=A0AAX6F961_IRIPA|nr:F-box/kelch-repeat protein [Iris pallida]